MLAGQDGPRSNKLARCRAIFHKKPPANRKEKRAARSCVSVFGFDAAPLPPQHTMCEGGILFVFEYTNAVLSAMVPGGPAMRNWIPGTSHYLKRRSGLELYSVFVNS